MMEDTVKEEYRLFDSQWMNIVNHEYCYRGYSVEEAVNLAVKMTEEAMAKNIRDGVWPMEST